MPIIHDIHTITIHDLVQSIADQTREYDGTILSLEREFAFAFEHRDYDIRSQFGMLDRAIKEKKESYNIEDLAYDIRYTNPDDTTRRDKHNAILNTLTQAYGIHLVRCPKCATVVCDPVTYHKDSSFTSDIKCPLCGLTFHSSSATDLFF